MRDDHDFGPRHVVPVASPDDRRRGFLLWVVWVPGVPGGFVAVLMEVRC